MASFTGDGGYDQDRVYASVAESYPEAAVIVPPRATAVPSDTAETAPTQRDRHLQQIAEHGRMAWQKASGHTSGDRGGRRRSCPQPHAGVRTPDLRPHRLKPDGLGQLRPHPWSVQQRHARSMPCAGVACILNRLGL